MATTHTLRLHFVSVIITLGIWSVPSSTDSSSANKTQVNVAVLLPLSKIWWSSYGRFVPIMFDQALKDIESRDDILSGYSLNFIYKDTQGNPGLAARRLSEAVTEPPKKVAVIGPALSEETNVVGQITHFYNLVEMSFVARTSSLLDKSSHPAIYLTNYLEEQFNLPRVQMMRYFGWQRAATLTELVDLFTSSTEELHRRMGQSNLTLVTSGVIKEKNEVSEQISRLKQYDARIIFGSFHSSTVAYVFCEAYRQGLYGPQYVWVLSGPSTYNTWLEKARPDVPCSKQELYEASNGYFTMDVEKLGDANQTTISGRTSSEFTQLLLTLQNGTTTKISSSMSFAYDSIWSLALALNRTAEELALKGASLEDFSYDNNTIYEEIKANLEVISFTGVSGPVSYGPNGQRIGFTYLKQRKDNVTRTLASFYPSDEDFEWAVDPASIWKGGKPPQDRFTYIRSYPGLSPGAGIALVTLSTLGLILAGCFLTFNIIYRHIRPIKMSSPNMNNLIIAGCVLMYISVYLQAIDVWRNRAVDMSYLCMVRTWVKSLAFTLSFGAIFSKTWRVHILFRNTELKKKSLRDHKLVALVALLTLVDLLILVPWTVFHPLIEKHEEFSQKVLAGGNVIATETFIQCYNNNQLYWISAQYIYKGLLLAFGTFLAWETRHVRIPALNDSREIGFCVYNVVVVCVFGVPIYHLLAANQSNLRFLISSSLIIFCTTLVLCIVFIPKILRRNDSEKPGIFLTVDGSVKSRVSDNDKASGTVVPSFTRTSKVAPEASTSLSTAHLVAHNASALDVQQGQGHRNQLATVEM